MRFLYGPREVGFVSLLFFATAVGHIFVSGDSNLKSHLRKLANEKNTSVVLRPSWQCCDNSAATLNLSEGYDLQQMHYECPEHPSNFSYYFKQAPEPSVVPIMGNALDPKKWRDKRVSFIGGSVTRQMHEQLLWENVPLTWSKYAAGHFLFARNMTNGACCKYDATHELDFRYLDPSVEAALLSSDVIVVNVASWWASNTIGYVTDVTGERFRVDSLRDDYVVVNNTQSDTLSFQFSALMEVALHLMLAKKRKGTTLVWRSESFSGCPSGDRGAISEVLQRLGIPVINITEATCTYVKAFPDQCLGPHLCFPSVAIRHWLKSLENQVL